MNDDVTYVTNAPWPCRPRQPRRIAGCTALWAFCLGLMSCAHADVMPLPPSPVAATLGRDDVFEMHVFGETELSGIYRVESDGSVSLPLAGRVMVEDLTPTEAGTVIAKKLSEFLRYPHVSIFVKEYNSKKIYVFGEVKNPGTFTYTDGMNIIQAITLAGGFDRLADKDGTFVTRVEEGKERQLKVSIKAIGEGRQANFGLRPGDIIYIPESFF